MKSHSNSKNITIISALIAILFIVAIVLITKSIVTASHNNHDHNHPSDITEHTTIPTEFQSESATNSLYYFDPDSFESYQKIDASKYIDQELPGVYSNAGYVYNDFASDTVNLGTNKKRVIVIDAGHQKMNSPVSTDVWMSPYLNPKLASSWTMDHTLKYGAQGVSTNINEYVVNHQVAALLKQELESAGYTVYLSHPDIDALTSAAERAAVANKHNADLMISIHCDYDQEYSNTTGATVYYPKVYDGYPSKRLSYLSKGAAVAILDEYASVTGIKKRPVGSWTDTSLFNFAKCPSILFELGFLSTPSEEAKLVDADFQLKIAQGLTRGICKYFALLENYDK